MRTAQDSLSCHPPSPQTCFRNSDVETGPVLERHFTARSSGTMSSTRLADPVGLSVTSCGALVRRVDQALGSPRRKSHASSEFADATQKPTDTAVHRCNNSPAQDDINAMLREFCTP